MVFLCFCLLSGYKMCDIYLLTEYSEHSTTKMNKKEKQKNKKIKKHPRIRFQFSYLMSLSFMFLEVALLPSQVPRGMLFVLLLAHTFTVAQGIPT